MEIKWAACVLILTLSLGHIHTQSEEEVDAFVNLILDVQRNYSSFVEPVDNEIYNVESDEELDFGTFDFIVIGSGSTGSVIAGRLAEVSQWKTLLIEAGSFGSLINEVPGLGVYAQFSNYSWAYLTQPSDVNYQGLNAKRGHFPRGKGIGGTSLINAMIYARANSSDFDLWSQLGNPGWAFNDVLPIFKRSEDFHHTDETAPYEPQFHGRGGPFHIEYSTPRSPQVDYFLEAHRELGFDVIDLNSNKLGVSPTQFNTKNGRRWHVGKAFIEPVLNRNNFHVLTGSYVTKININPDTKTAESVSFTSGGKRYTATASKEIVLSAGAINSPQILMLSGVGPKAHLESLNISVIANLEVGTVMTNHPIYSGLIFNSNYTSPIKSLNDYVKEFLNGKGQLTGGFHLNSIGYYESSYTRGTGVADLELIMVPSVNIGQPLGAALNFNDQSEADVYGNAVDAQSFSIIVEDLHAISAGTVRLNSSNPFDRPLVDTNYYSDPYGRDIQVLYEGIELALNLSRTEAFKEINTTLASEPLKACERYEFDTKQYWYCAIRQIATDLWHPVATCRMGPNPDRGAVVDNNLKVHGIDRLRVADASTFPFSLIGHPQAVCVMIGEKLAEMLKFRYL